MAQGITLKFYTRVVIESKLKVRKTWGYILMEGSGWVIGFFRPTHLSVFWIGLISHMVGEMVTKCS